MRLHESGCDNQINATAKAGMLCQLQPFRFMFPHMGATSVPPAEQDDCSCNAFDRDTWLIFRKERLHGCTDVSCHCLAGVFPWVFRSCGFCSKWQC